MSQENVQLARDAVDAWNRGDWDDALRDASPDFVWDNSRSLREQRGIYTLDQVKDFWASFTSNWQSVRIELDEVIDAGDFVVLPHTTHVRGRDGIEVKARTTWVFTYRDGKWTRGSLYQDRAEALEAAGLSE